MEEIDHADVRAARERREQEEDRPHVALHLLGAIATICGTMAAILSVPDDPQPRGALFWPAVWCSLGLLTAPLLGLRKSTQTIFRAENLLMIGLVYWLLLDLLQGAYPLVDVSYDDVMLGFHCHWGDGSRDMGWHGGYRMVSTANGASGSQAAVQQRGCCFGPFG